MIESPCLALIFLFCRYIATIIVGLNEVIEIKSRRMEGRREIVANSALHLNIVRGGPTHDPKILRQIDSLKKEIEF